MTPKVPAGVNPEHSRVKLKEKEKEKEKKILEYLRAFIRVQEYSRKYVKRGRHRKCIFLAGIHFLYNQSLIYMMSEL